MTEESLSAPRRVFLHVGAPKTGTTFLQKLLLANRGTLREHGVLFPADTYDTQFFAAVDLQDGMFHGTYREDSRGRWAEVARAAREWPGTSVISHEVLAGATVKHAQRAVDDLAPAEVHVVYTVRDLGRQLTSRWHEDVKHNLYDSFAAWWAAVEQHDDSYHHARMFWRTDDPTDVLARWGKAVGPERFHLITVPRRSGGDLWQRFAGVIGCDPALADPGAVDFANTGLGVAEIELVRRVNLRLRGTLSPLVYEQMVKGVLAHETLSRHPDARRLTLPAEVFPAVERIARRWATALAAERIDVVGDLEELIPRPVTSDEGDPGSVTDAELAETAAWTVTELLLRLHEERQANHTVLTELREQLRELPRAWKALRAPLGRARRLTTRTLKRAEERVRRSSRSAGGD